MTYKALDADQRGGTAPSGKPSLTVADAAARLVREGLTWQAPGQPLTITYAYRATAPGAMPEDTGGFERLNSQQIGAVESALNAWAKVANITFVRVGDGTYGDNATILFGGYTAGAAGASAFAYLPGDRSAASVAGDVWINENYAENYYPGQGGDYGYLTILHEIGHALGLSHPSDYDAEGSGATLSYAANASYNEDSLEYSVMSYFDISSTGGYAKGLEPYTPLMDDIAAVQRLYGANLAANAGDTVYGVRSSAIDAADGSDAFFSGTGLYGTIWDGGGTDTLDLGYDTTDDRVDLHAGAFSDVGGRVGSLSIALGVTIENAVGGSGNDTLIGNDVANHLIGGAGDDVLTGGSGYDILDGGAGNDRAVIASTLAQASFAIGAGGDILVTSPYGQDDLIGIETIAFLNRDLPALTVTSVDQLYLSYMGRDAASPELGYWIGDIVGGGSLAEERAAILADGAGHTHTLATVGALYQFFMGRDASAAELGYWEGQVRAGSDFAAVRQVIAADPGSQAPIANLIGQSYGDYLGRAPTVAETSYWRGQLAAGITIGQFDAALARDGSAYQHTTSQIGDAYLFGLGRAPTLAEQNYWLAQLRTGTNLHDMRIVIANDTAAAGKSDGTVTAIYTEYMGRAPNAAELVYWAGQARAGAALSDMRIAVLGDPAGHAHADAVITGEYQAVFGRAPGEQERSVWFGLFQAGATAGTLEAALVQDGAATGVLRASAGTLNSTTVLPAGFSHAVISSFNYQPGSSDPYAGASVLPADIDRIDLRQTAFAGSDPLSHAHAVTELNGQHDVLISYDGQHDILLLNTTLAAVHAEQFVV